MPMHSSSLRRGVALALAGLWLAGASSTVLGARTELDLSGAWQYQKVAALSFPPPATNWSSATVPGYLSGWNYERAWFRKSFTVPASMAGTRLKLRFGGAKFQTQVWLNGTFIGTYLNGYEPFEFDVTAQALVGQNNDLVVGVSDWTALFAQPVDFSQKPAGTEPRDFVKTNLLAPIGGRYDLYGLWQPVKLLSVPAVSIAEVFALPSVRTQQLTVRVTLRNDGPMSQTVTLTNRVLDSNGPVLLLPAQQLTLPGGAMTNLEVSAAWTNAHRWSHLDPFLYVLENTVTSGAGADTVQTRFGFREFWVQGDRCFLNGTPINLLASAMWPPSSFITNGQIRKVFQDVKAGNNVALRLHTQPWDYRWYDIADEVGILLVEECAVWCDPGAYRLSDPAFWANYAQHVTAAVKRDWNHPSIILWSLENEILHCGGARLSTNAAPQLAALGRLAKGLDPTRPITYEADLDPGGEADILGLHYPYEFPDHQVWPNAAYWMDQYIARDWVPGGQWRWDRTKPLYIGEFLWVPGTSAQDFTILFGDDAYSDPGYYRNLAKAQTWRMAVEAYRSYGVNGLGPWTMFEDPAVNGSLFDLNPGSNTLYQAQQAAYHPNAVFVEEYSPRCFAGETATRNLRVYHDRMAAGNLTLRWRAGAGAWQSRAFTMQPADRRRETVTFGVPSATGSFTLEIQVLEGAATLFSNRLPYVAMARSTLSRPAGVNLGVFDPYGSVAPRLTSSGVPFATVTNLSTETYAGFNVFVVGREALTNDTVIEAGRLTVAAKWQDFMLRGGWVLVLEQTNYPAWMPYDLRVTSFDASHAFPNAAHPVMQGLTTNELRWWAGDHRVVTRALAAPSRGSFRVLAGIGSPSGLEYAAAVEMPVGSGGLLCAQWLVTERFDAEPLAGVLLQRMLDYCAPTAPHLALRPAGLVAESNSAPAVKLAELGLISENLLGRPMNFSSATHPVVVVAGSDAVWQSAAAQLAGLASYVDGGGKLVLHRPSSQFVAAAKATLFPRLDAVDARLGRVLRRDPTNAAVRLTSHDLFWIETPGTWNQAEVASTNVARRFYRKQFNLPTYATIQVENMPIKTSGGSAAGGWWLYSAGYVAQNISVSQAGLHLFNVKARGTPAAGGWPQMSLKIDGRAQDSVSVTSTQIAFYTVSADLTPGVHQLALSFDNDFYAAPEDRNLFLDEIRWGFDSDTTTTPLASPGVVAQVRRGSGVVMLDEVMWESETKNATKAGRYAATLLTGLGAALRLPGATSLEAEAMTNVNINAYGVAGGIVYANSGGRIQNNVRFTTSGNYVFDLIAGGQPMSNIWPLVAFKLDGVTRTNLAVNTASLSHFTFVLPVTAGTHLVGLDFVNDGYAPPEDRNVFYDRLLIAPETPPPGPPLINLIQPAPGTVLPAGTPVNLLADASDFDGAVTNVTFFADGTRLAEDDALPYNFTWTNPPAGYHALTATAADNRGLSATSAPVTFAVLPSPVTLVATGSVWRYLDDGSDQGAAWRAITFADSLWKSGPAKLGSNDNPRTTINLGPVNARFITTWFRHSFVLSNAAAYTNLAFRVLRDDGAVVWLNDTELFRMNMTNSGPITYTNLALTAVEGAEETIYFLTNVAAAALRNGTNVLAVELHQVNRATTDAGFDLELVAQAQPPPPAPQLSWTLTGGNLVLGWAAGPGTFAVETATNLIPPVSWIPGAVTNPLTESQRFFRLRWP